MIDGIEAEMLIADKGYDSQAVVDAAQARGRGVVIPPRKNRKDQRHYDHLYKIRHLVENGFLRLKQWRGIATRYAKNAASYLAAVQFRCIVWWLSIL